MNILKLALALVVALQAPLYAQAVYAGPAAADEAEKPEPSCPCERYNYKALTPKGTALLEYWDARRKAKTARGVSSIFLLFAVMAHSGGAANQAQDSYGKAMGELYAARAKAEAAGAVKVTGEDLKGDSIEFLVKKGVDYDLTR